MTLFLIIGLVALMAGVMAGLRRWQRRRLVELQRLELRLAEHRVSQLAQAGMLAMLDEARRHLPRS